MLTYNDSPGGGGSWGISFVYFIEGDGFVDNRRVWRRGWKDSSKDTFPNVIPKNHTMVKDELVVHEHSNRS